jgi:trigger factor
LIGRSLEEETEVKVTFPENYRKDDIAGKDAVFKVKINQIKEKELPELDDEFVKEVSEFETLEEMKADLREKLLKNAEDTSNRSLKRVN